MEPRWQKRCGDARHWDSNGRPQREVGKQQDANAAGERKHIQVNHPLKWRRHLCCEPKEGLDVWNCMAKDLKGQKAFLDKVQGDKYPFFTQESTVQLKV